MSPISLSLAAKLEAFPAVYRAPSLFWHLPGYEFPGVRGRSSDLAKSEAFAIPFEFHSRWNHRHPFAGITLPRRRAYSATLCGRSGGFPVYRRPFAGLGVFLPFGCCHPSKLWLPDSTRERSGVRSAHQLSLQRVPPLDLPCGGVFPAALFSDSIWRLGFPRPGSPWLSMVSPIPIGFFPSPLLFPVRRGRQVSSWVFLPSPLAPPSRVSRLAALPFAVHRRRLAFLGGIR